MGGAFLNGVGQLGAFVNGVLPEQVDWSKERTYMYAPSIPFESLL